MALQQLEIPQESFSPPQQSPPHVITAYLNDFKDTVKKQRKILAKKYHPDVCSDENSLDKMKTINESADFLEKINIQNNQMPMMHQMHPMHAMNEMFSRIIIINGQQFQQTQTSNSSNRQSFSFSFSFNPSNG